MEEKIDILKKNNMWEFTLETEPSVKWVFKTKRNAKRDVEMYKATNNKGIQQEE